MDSTLRRTWAEIDMDALAHNYETLRKRIGENVKFLGVVKADAYGHGSVQVSRLLQESGADYLAVSSIDEAVELRHNGITMPVLILGHTPKEEVSELIKKPDFAKITAKLNELKDEKESLLAYKKNLLETADSKESESVKKQLKNINNRLQAIEYTENCLTKVKKRLQSEGTIFLASLLFIEILFFGLLMITANR